MVNVLNFYSNRDHGTGKQMPYYEPFDDELILNMPLPCSHAAWSASCEEDWRAAMLRPPNMPLDPSSSTDVNGPGCGTLASEILLKNILSSVTREDLQGQLGQSAGFGDSDQLRNLIILCAGEQFSGFI